MNSQQQSLSFSTSSTKKPEAKNWGMALAGFGAGMLVGFSGYSGGAGQGFNMGTTLPSSGIVRYN